MLQVVLLNSNRVYVACICILCSVQAANRPRNLFILESKILPIVISVNTFHKRQLPLMLASCENLR